MPLVSEAVIAISLTKFPERGIQRRAVAGPGARAGRYKPTFHDFLEEAVLDQPLPMRAAQVFRLEYPPSVLLELVEHF